MFSEHLRLPRCLGLAAIALCVGMGSSAPWARESSTAQVTVVAAVDLPAEARETLKLIRQGGPFPHARDGIVFGNREGLLPQRPRGSYREYTVRTPGIRDRGARRIVKSDKGEFYYTADHYRSFQRILQ